MRASDEELIARWGSMCEAKSGGFRWCAKSGLGIVAPMFIRINSSNAAGKRSPANQFGCRVSGEGTTVAAVLQAHSSGVFLKPNCPHRDA